MHNGWGEYAVTSFHLANSLLWLTYSCLEFEMDPKKFALIVLLMSSGMPANAEEPSARHRCPCNFSGPNYWAQSQVDQKSVRLTNDLSGWYPSVEQNLRNSLMLGEDDIRTIAGGRLELFLLVGKSGKVRSVKVVRSSGDKRLDTLVGSAIRRSHTFSPAPNSLPYENGMNVTFRSDSKLPSRPIVIVSTPKTR